VKNEDRGRILRWWGRFKCIFWTIMIGFLFGLMVLVYTSAIDLNTNQLVLIPFSFNWLGLFFLVAICLLDMVVFGIITKFWLLEENIPKKVETPTFTKEVKKTEGEHKTLLITILSIILFIIICAVSLEK